MASPELYQKLESLVKAVEAGGYNAAPGTLMQGSALQVEDCSPVMHNVTYGDKQIKLQKEISVKAVKSTFVQFNRRLSYGVFGGSAQLEGAVGQEQTSDYVRVGVAMNYYSEIRRTTLVANMVQTQTGEAPEDLEAEAAALRIAGDIEFDLFRGKDDFSNAGVFDGNPTVIPPLPNILGLQVQIRQSDVQSNTQDLMFNSYGSGLSNVIPGGGTLTQNNVEDANVRSAMNHGSADKLVVDPLVLSAYNKITQGKERIILAGSPQDATGSDLRRQWVSGGTVQVEASRFLSGRTSPTKARNGAPGAPSISATPSGTGGTTGFASGAVYKYYVTAENTISESGASGVGTWTVGSNGDQLNLTITAATSGNPAAFFNVYRTLAGGAAASARFIGRVMNSGAATTVFVDLGNKIPGFVTGVLVQSDTMDMPELSPYSRIKLAVSDLSTPEAHFKFCSLRVTEPRKDVLIENLKGDL